MQLGGTENGFWLGFLSEMKIGRAEWEMLVAPILHVRLWTEYLWESFVNVFGGYHLIT